MIEPKRSEPIRRDGGSVLSGFFERVLVYIDPSRSEDPERIERILSTRLQSIDGVFRNPRGVKRSFRRF